MGKEKINEKFLSSPWASKKHQGDSEEAEKPFDLHNKAPNFH